MQSNPRKNQIVPLEITGITHEGSGVGRWEGMAVFVPGTAVGDKLLAKLVKVHKNYAYGILTELTKPSLDRVENLCPAYRRCGGCSLRHISYPAETLSKEGWLRDSLRHIGSTSIPLDPFIPAPRDSRYRNKAQYPIRLVDGRVRAGFFAKRSHDLIPVEDCLLQPALFGSIAGVVCAFLEEYGIPPYDEAAHTGLVRHLYLRLAEATGEVMVCLAVNGQTLPHWQELVRRLRGVAPGFKTLVLSVNRERTNVILGEKEIPLVGDGRITDVLCGVRAHLSPRSFYQVNRQAAESLYRAAAEYAAPSREGILLDLYCGAGTIGLSMADGWGELIGVEVVPQAVENARENAAANGVTNARFLCADAGQAAALLAREGIRPDTAVLDPPRKGAGKEVLDGLTAMSPSRIIYVSCDPATLARDCGRLAERGYRAVQGRGVDLFPRTAHVESVVVLERHRYSPGDSPAFPQEG